MLKTWTTFRGVVDNIRGAKDTIVSKPKEFAHLIKNRFGSADNINDISKWVAFFFLNNGTFAQKGDFCYGTPADLPRQSLSNHIEAVDVNESFV